VNRQEGKTVRSQPSNTYFQRFMKTWNGFVQIAALILATIGGFLLPPPPGVSNDSNSIWLQLAKFVVPVVVGLVFVAAQRWNSRSDAWLWWGVALASLIFGLVALFSYQSRMNAWTVDYYGTQVVIGSEKTSQGQRASVEASTDENLLKFFDGKVEEAWTKQSVDHRRLFLAAAYLSNLPLFTICFMAIVQASYCINKRD
jgi:hypothetical protein